MTHFHIICGSTGAGKSTYSKKLSAETGGLHFAIDEWMVALFWQDSPQPIQFEWTIERINRCEKVIASMAIQAVARGVPAILDLGFTTALHRQKFAAIAKEASLGFELHFLDVPETVRWARVQQRNAEKGATYALDVDRKMFEFMESIWEPPTAEEVMRLNGRRVEPLS